MNSLSDIDETGILKTDQMDNAADEWSRSIKDLEELEKESNKHPDFKSLFRKVVIRCHPDKLPSDLTEAKLNEYKVIYEDSVEANETEDWAKLIRCAIKLEIELPESAYDQIESIENSINKLKEKQNNILGSVAWRWYQTNDGAAKSDILKQHLDFMDLLTRKK